MILAAGRGERLRPLTDTIPKPLLRVAGRSLLDWHLKHLHSAGIRQVVINHSWQGTKIVEALGNGVSYGLHIEYSDEGNEALETGGGIFKALALLGDEPFLVINGDIYCDMPLRGLSLANGMLAHLVMVPNPEHNPHGDFALANGKLALEGERHTFSGIGVYSHDLFSESCDGVFPLAPLLKKAIAAGKASGVLWQGRWHDIGTPERLRALDRLLCCP